MVVMRIQGGLGNQMFQWACGRALSKERKVKLTLEVTPYRFDTNRKFQLNQFPNVMKFLDQEKIEFLGHDGYGLIPQGFQQINDDFKTFKFPDGNLFMNGYWQSEKHFLDIKELIREDFDLSQFSYVSKSFPEIKEGVSLHIRRTDYVTSNGFHPVQSLSYYEKALEILENDYSGIYIFSDDIDWCKQNIKFDNCYFVDNKNEMESLWLMSNCKHNITANSSFSWWAAWLNKNENKKVICPSKWFGDVANINSENVYFENCFII